MTVAFKPRRPSKRVEVNPFVQVRKSHNVIPLDRIRQNRMVKPTPYSREESPIRTIEAKTTTVVEVLPRRQELPLWLKGLITVKQISSVAACVLMGGAMTFYGLKVYGESRWTGEYPRLEHLRQQEQQLRLAKEILKHTIVESAQDPDAGLEIPTPDNIIYVQPAEPRPATGRELSSIVNPPWSSPPQTNQPLAY
ncbi:MULTISPECIES: hypothetical protein [Arthrospira]|jgi:hypothetical protein|uniref:Cell division protein FtsL n=1 Tax=Limnospira platensis NIES-46 TaxID=1236695 RepID=A0A5M3T4D1_LIMPL|nr:hypothetical protein [Arthrospira platensis]AMW26972.1 hypothetical protein AP285_02150 [Arthrospira platensis YZ]KDR54640.1 hypothetical protein APPUASWS_027525 [Arthrospira platensis str. Paraca]MBD2670763.1 hypothetical protein [Arthrospira platensis FACHB-439]MBD2711322.1 hypothetical protein [Arthrospira platensis FACHB-835]MDF2211622.1 hypothetical protein [Arthrospira platensis NCB002]MDT9183984.1 hypothetical protein [Limnospira sp. PMC 289.06]MDT9296206.1 hypothetical protein [Ar